MQNRCDRHKTRSEWGKTQFWGTLERSRLFQYGERNSRIRKTRRSRGFWISREKLRAKLSPFGKGEDPYKWARKVKYEQRREHEQILRTYPSRNIVETPRGVESRVVCAFWIMVVAFFGFLPEIDGAERYAIAMRKGVCKYCLGASAPTDADSQEGIAGTVQRYAEQRWMTYFCTKKGTMPTLWALCESESTNYKERSRIGYQQHNFPRPKCRRQKYRHSEHRLW